MSMFTRLLNKAPAAPPGPAAAALPARLAATLAAVRKQTGRPETVRVPHRCAKTGLPYAIIFERFDPRERFTIARIEKIGTGTLTS